MRKKSFFLIFLMCFGGILLFIPVIKADGTYSLSPRTYYRRNGYMTPFDTYVWSFSSSASEILVLALDQAQYDAFYNQYLSKYTARLNKYSQWNDGGEWRPPRFDTWYILYINTGDSTTLITINDDIKHTSLLYIIGFTVGGIGIAIIIGVLSRSKKRKERKPEEFVAGSFLNAEVTSDTKKSKVFFRFVFLLIFIFGLIYAVFYLYEHFEPLLP